MRRMIQVALLLVVMISVCSAQQIVDRIVATVDREPILLSDWEVEMRYEAMLDQKLLPLSDDAARAALDRLIDQQLVREQIRSYGMTAPGATEVADRLADIRKQLNAQSEDVFRTMLARYGLTDSELRGRIATQLLILRFIDVRLRPSVHVERRSIEAYYNDTLVPELKKKGADVAPLSDVSSEIEELLAQQRVEALTNDWLKDLRQQSKIHIDPAAGGPQPSASTRQPQQGTP